MKIKKILTIFTIVMLGLSVNTQMAFGVEYVKGQSLVAEDQVAAGKGLNFPGLEISWLDFGDDHVQYYSSMDVYSEGVFRLNMLSQIVYFDTTGKVIAVGDYSGGYNFSDGMAKVYKYIQSSNSDAGRLIGPPGIVEGFIDIEGNEIIPLGKLANTSGYFHEGMVIVGGYDQKKGYVNKSGEIVIPQIYENAGDFEEGLAPVQDSETGLWKFIDKEGNTVIPVEYEYAERFSDGLAYVVKGGLAGYIDKSGSTVIDFKFETEVDYSDMDGNSSGAVAASVNSPENHSFYDGIAAARDTNGKYGYIDKSGDFVIPAVYHDADPFKGAVAFVTSENTNYLNGYGSRYIINKKGERLTSLWMYGGYSGEPMKDGLIRALSSYGPSSHEYVVMLNQYGAEVISSDFKIEYLSPFNQGFAMIMAFNNESGKTAIGILKKPNDTDNIKSSKLIKIYLNEERFDFEDTDPIIENSRLLVPVRAVLESLGADINWDADTNTVTAQKGETKISFKIGDNMAYVNNVLVKLDVPAEIRNSRTLVPLRFIAESLGANVSWNAEEMSAYIDLN